MTEPRRRPRRDADLSALSPADMDEIVRTFAATLRQTRELETERLRFAISQLELFRDEMIAWNEGMRAGRLFLTADRDATSPASSHYPAAPNLPPGA
jgi:hypothetical protein